MYSLCRIRFVDDGSEMDVVIKSSNDVITEEDESIFFYGLSPDEIKRAIANKTIMENEWQILDLSLVMDNLVW